jgi:hypothetical protein
MVAAPVDTTPGVFDDGSHASFDVWGVYGSTLSTKSVGLDVYYLGLARDAAHFDQGTANETRHSFGAHPRARRTRRENNHTGAYS